jgi:hypothetical protein
MFWPGFLELFQIDHRCHVPLCVRPSHLRPATNKQNAENLRGPTIRNMSSGRRGVYWDRDRQKWHVKVHHNGRTYYGGRFTDLADAEQAAINLRNRFFTQNDADRMAST